MSTSGITVMLLLWAVCGLVLMAAGGAAIWWLWNWEDEMAEPGHRSSEREVETSEADRQRAA